MKGIVFRGNRRCEVREFPKPRPSADEVLVRIEATGICGSDLHVYRGERSSDQIRGHEPCGVVEALGPDVIRLKVGDRVTVHHHQGCGVCYECVRGETVACRSPRKTLFGVSIPGSFAEYTVAKERNCVVLADAMSFADGAFCACVGGTAYGALRRLGVGPYGTLGVFGLGPVGLSCVIVGKTLGLRVIAADVIPERVELGLKCGADRAFNAAESDPAPVLTEFGEDIGVDYIIETSGSAPARRCIIPSLRRGGKAAIVGVGSNDEVINPSHIHGRAVTILGSVVFHLSWLWDLVALCRRSGMSFEPALTHRFGLDDGPSALQLADRGCCGKVLFLPHGEVSS